MSRERPEPVRQPVSVRARSRRALDERLGLRFPRASAALGGLVYRLPSHSRLRRALIRRSVELGIAAANRKDLEAAFVHYHPDIEWVSPPPVVALGFDPICRGREARINVQRRWTDEWGDFQFKPEEIIDAGTGRVLIIGRMEGAGLSSGAAFDNDWADLFTVAAGRVTREQVFFDRAEALEAVGLTE